MKILVTKFPEHYQQSADRQCWTIKQHVLISNDIVIIPRNNKFLIIKNRYGTIGRSFKTMEALKVWLKEIGIIEAL